MKELKTKWQNKNKNMKNYVLIIWILFLTNCGSQEKEVAEEKLNDYNILWIVADDLGIDLGCYGNKLIRTPNLDKFASESVRYENLHTTTAVCSPSRSGLITGMYPVTIGVHQHRTRFKRKLPDSIKPITEYFKEAGYFVTNGRGNKNDKGGKTDYNFDTKGIKMYQAGHWSKRAEGQKFFSQAQIFFPHRPFHEDSLHPVNPDLVTLPPYYPNHPLAKKDWALYLETVQHVDESFGKIIKQLEEEDLLDKTIIFFFGDQGRPHLRAKQFMYDSGTNTPLMIRYPDGYGAGTVSEELVSNIDIPAATLALAGIEKPSYMQGQDFLSEDIERKYTYSMRDRRDETVDRIRSVRSSKFKYIKNYYTDRPYTQFNAYKEMRYPMLPLMSQMLKEGKLNDVQKRFMSNYRPAEELYDLENDPFETINLTENEVYKEELEKMRSVLSEWISKNDLGEYPEPQEEIDAASKEAARRYRKTSKERGLENATHKQWVEYWEERYNIK